MSRIFINTIAKRNAKRLRFCNGVDENFQHHFVIVIGYCISKIGITILLPHKSFHNNRDIFYDEMVLIFFINTIAKPFVKKLTVDQIGATVEVRHVDCIDSNGAFHIGWWSDIWLYDTDFGHITLNLDPDQDPTNLVVRSAVASVKRPQW